MFSHPKTWALVLAAGMSVSLAAQNQPDFSGRWLLLSDPQPPDTPIALSVQQTVVRAEVWSLDAEGRLVLRITTRGSTVRPETVTLIYRRALQPVPSDFAFRFEFGMCTTDVVDTFKGLFVRDLGPRNSPVSVAFVLPSEVLEEVHDAILGARFFEYPSTFSVVGDEHVMPADHYRLTVRSGGVLHSVSWVDDTTSPSEEANRLQFLFARIKRLSASRPEVKHLPPARVDCL